MRLQEKLRTDCVLACLCHTEQTLSSEYVFDSKLDCELNFVWSHEGAADRRENRERKCLRAYSDAVSV